MANNRLYLVDTATGDKIMLCKSMGTGWYIPYPEEVSDWLSDGRDSAAAWGSGTGPTTLVLKDENTLYGRKIEK